MKKTIKDFAVQNLSERSKSRLKKFLSFILYCWAFVIVILPLIILKVLKIIPLGKRFYIGTPLVRYYWQNFLLKHISDFHGDALDIDNKTAIEYYGQQNKLNGGAGLNCAHVLDVEEHYDKKVDWVADLSNCWNIPTGRYDLFVVQFTYHMIEKDKEALYHSIRIIKEGGILLCNFPSVSGYLPKGLVYRDKAFTDYVYHWYTPIIVELTLRQSGLKENDFEMVVNGNWLARMLYLGFYIPKEIVPSFLLKKDDPSVPLLISVRIKKPLGWDKVYPAFPTN